MKYFNFDYDIPLLDFLSSKADVSRQFAYDHSMRKPSHLLEDIRCNLENILNTRLMDYHLDDEQSSDLLRHYGMPDSIYTDTYQNESICHTIKQAICSFESRLNSVSVRIADENRSKRNINIVVNARLNGKRMGDTVKFTTNVDAMRRQMALII